jgi:hypothetical protein
LKFATYIISTTLSSPPFLKKKVRSIFWEKKVGPISLFKKVEYAAPTFYEKCLSIFFFKNNSKYECVARILNIGSFHLFLIFRT